MKWFTKGWWEYLLEERKDKLIFFEKINVFICRVKGHPKGVWWYNPLGIEPDMHCKNCGDDLG